MLHFPISIGDYFAFEPSLPRELLDFEFSPETLARDTFLLNAASVSALTWVVYDMVLNFNREVNLVWKRWHEPKGRHSRRLYVIVRYFSVAALACFVGVNMSVGLSLDFCRVWYYIVLVNTTIITLLPDVMLLIRVNAVYSWNFRTLLFTIFLSMIQTTTSLVAGVLAVMSAQFPSQYPASVSGCPVALSPSVARFTLVAWIPSILAQATYLGFMLSTLAHLIRSLDVGSPPPPRPANNNNRVSVSLLVPSPASARPREKLPAPSPSTSYTPSPSRSPRRPRVLKSAPPRLSSLPIHHLPQPSPLASTSTVFPTPHPHTSPESAATLVSTSKLPYQSAHHSSLNHNSNRNPTFTRRPPLPSVITRSANESSNTSAPNMEGIGLGKVAVENQEAVHPRIQRSRTISIQARDNIHRHPPSFQEDRKTWSKGPYHGTGSRWKYSKYTPPLFSLFSWRALRQVQRLVPTMMVFVGHGGWYFTLGILAKVANAIMVTRYSGPLQAVAIPFMLALYPVLVSRIYLSMVHYLHFGLAMKNPRLMASYEGENYASGYRGDTGSYEMDDDDDDIMEDFVDGDLDQTRFTSEDASEVWEAENEQRYRSTLGRLRFSIGGSRLKVPESGTGNGNGKGRGSTAGRVGYDGPGRGHRPRGPRLGRITFAARESLANSSVLDLGFGNEEF